MEADRAAASGPGRRRPPEETGTSEPRVEPCLGYLVVHPEGTLLFDTGMGGDPWVDQHYRPRRTGLAQALSSGDAGVDDIDLVANCHLQFDHCAGNGLFAREYVTLHDYFGRGANDIMKTLKSIRARAHAPAVRADGTAGE